MGDSFISHICLWTAMSLRVGASPVVYHPKKSISENTCLTLKIHKVKYSIFMDHTYPIETLTLFFFCTIIFFIDDNVFGYFAKNQLERIHNFDISTLLFADDSADHWNQNKQSIIDLFDGQKSLLFSNKVWHKMVSETDRNNYNAVSRKQLFLKVY